MSKLFLRTVPAVLFCALWMLSNARLASSFQQQAELRASGTITADMVRPHIIKLAGDEFEGRGAGYSGELKAARYIADEFKKIGLRPMGDLKGSKRAYFQEFKFQPYHPVVAWEVMTSRNVLGSIEGSDPSLKDEVVVIAAHYDGQGRAGQADPTRQVPTDATAPKDEIWNSANDNATSVAAIIEIARAIKSGKLITKRSLLFIAFGAEEHGMSGSINYVNHPAFPLKNHVAMINLEKLGRSPEKPLSINGGASSSSWPEIMKAAQEQTKTKVSPNIPFAIPDSDHYPFGASRIPAVMLYVSGVEAHQPSDTSDKIDFARTAEAARYAMAMLLALADRPTRPELAQSPIPELGLIAHLATSAEADASGLSAEESGLKVTGVINGQAAAVAGLQVGDLILEIASIRFRRDHTIASLMAMQRQLLEGKMGSNVAVKALRRGKILQLTLRLRP